MKSDLGFFLGLFAALGVSYAGIVLASNAQLGSLAPYYDENSDTAFPKALLGVAFRGQAVYRDLGCAACHTQEVRRPGFGSDQARGWGERQSVARDYIFQPSPQLGLYRIGPDLTNVGDRRVNALDADAFYRQLYAGSWGMPSYRFLFEMRHVGLEAQPSDDALNLTGALEPEAGWEVVPTQRARDLVGYLVNLRTAYDYPEAFPMAAAKPEGAAPGAPPPKKVHRPAPPGAEAGAPTQVPTSPGGTK